mmetsp:Transcript_8904/g.30666  ORF Transcript_8904/g.30666 Transcript_8904/m.30666 type:complete len:352 (-) Transcript_8904:8-1063(-)
MLRRLGAVDDDDDGPDVALVRRHELGPVEGVRLLAEGPARRGAAEVGLFRRAVHDAACRRGVDVVVPRLVGDEVQVSAGRPGRLDDARVAVCTSDDGLLRRGAARDVDLHSHKLGSVPGHVRMVPLQVSQRPARRREARRRVKVGARRQDHRRGQGPVQGHGDDGVLHGAAFEVRLADAIKKAARRVDGAVRVAHRFHARRELQSRQRDRGAGNGLVEALVGEVRVDDLCLLAALVQDPRPAAVLVDLCPAVVVAWNGVGDAPLRIPAHDDAAPCLGGAGLEPVDCVFGRGRVGEADCGLGQRNSSHRRLPRPVRRLQRHGHPARGRAEAGDAAEEGEQRPHPLQRLAKRS